MNQDNKTARTGKGCHQLRSAAWLMTILMFSSPSNPCRGQGTDGTNNASTPERNLESELSLKALYHPLEKIEFFEQKPRTHWMDDAPSRLFIKRQQGWNEVDLSTGDEKSWDLPGILAQRLAKLEGVTESMAETTIDRAIDKLKHTDGALLVRIDRGLAILSRTQDPKWVSKDVTQWRDISLDSSGSTLAYTLEHDLFVMDLPTGKHLRLTKDGSDTNLNGRLDWTYQEEIFGRGNFKGFWLHPDGKWLAMMKVNTELVPEYSLGSSSDDRGIGQVSRYPKAGDPIPHASLLVWNLERIKTGRIPRPTILMRSTPDQERLITGVWWHPVHHCLVYTVSDRCQTWREIRCLRADLSRGDLNYHRVAYREENNAWIEPPSKPSFLSDGNIMWMSESPSGYSQVYRLSFSKQKVSDKASGLSLVTPPEVHVRNFWISPDESRLVYTADHVTGTVEQHVYQLDLQSNKEVSKLTDKSGWSDPSISPDWKWLLIDHSHATSPNQLSVSALDSPSSEALQLNSPSLQQTLRDPEFLSVPTPDGLKLPAAIIRPASSSEDKVPVVIEVYGGPGAARVTNRWRGNQNLYRELLARQGIATFIVDNRSSAGRGLKDAWSIKGRVGEVEMNDLRHAVQWLKEQDWVDPDRLLLRGWSFGGYMTISGLTRTQDFKAGIAGGSVTDWSEYDAFYTERYMGLPQKNKEGYHETAPIHRADKLHGALLMIHGEADDNVHPTGTMRMAKALQKAGKPFQLMIYPDEAHAIRKADNVWHLSQMTDDFIKRHLLP